MKNINRFVFKTETSEAVKTDKGICLILDFLNSDKNAKLDLNDVKDSFMYPATLAKVIGFDALVTSLKLLELPKSSILHEIATLELLTILENLKLCFALNIDYIRLISLPIEGKSLTTKEYRTFYSYAKDIYVLDSHNNVIKVPEWIVKSTYTDFESQY